MKINPLITEYSGHLDHLHRVLGEIWPLCQSLIHKNILRYNGKMDLITGTFFFCDPGGGGLSYSDIVWYEGADRLFEKRGGLCLWRIPRKATGGNCVSLGAGCLPKAYTYWQPEYSTKCVGDATQT